MSQTNENKSSEQSSFASSPCYDWDICETNMPKLQYSRWVKCIAIIKKNETGEIREYKTKEILLNGHDSPSVFNWEENNFSCDCNRELFFERANGNELDDVKCSDGRFSVNLKNPKTGKIYYEEFKS